MNLHYDLVRSSRFDQAWRPPPDELAHLRRALRDDGVVMALDRVTGEVHIGRVVKNHLGIPWASRLAGGRPASARPRQSTVIFFESIKPIDRRTGKPATQDTAKDDVARGCLTAEFVAEMQAADPMLNGGQKAAVRAAAHYDRRQRDRLARQRAEALRANAGRAKGVVSRLVDEYGAPSLGREQRVALGRHFDAGAQQRTERYINSLGGIPERMVGG